MRKRLFSTVIALFLLFVTFTPALALETAPVQDVDALLSDASVLEAVRATAEDEGNGLTNPDLVEPHQWLNIHLPDGSVERAEILPADFTHRKNDCLWWATVRLQVLKFAREQVQATASAAQATPIQATPTVAAYPPLPDIESYEEEAGETADGLMMWPALIALLLAVLAFGGLFSFHLFQRKKLDADRLPPVVPGGLSRDLPTALATERFRTSGTGFTPRVVTAGYFRRVTGSKLLGIIPDPRNYFQAEMGFAGGTTDKANVVEGETYYRYSDAKGRHMFSRFSCGNYAIRLEVPAGWEFVEGTSYRPSENSLVQLETSVTVTAGGVNVLNSPFRMEGEGEGSIELVTGQPGGEFYRPAAGTETVAPTGEAGDVNVQPGAPTAYQPIQVPPEMTEWVRWSGFVPEPDMTFQADPKLTEPATPAEKHFCTKCGFMGNPDARYCGQCGNLLGAVDPAAPSLPETEKKEPSRYVKSIPTGAFWGLPEAPVEGRVMVEPTPAPVPVPAVVATVESKRLTTSVTFRGEDGKEYSLVIQQDPGMEPVTQVRAPGGFTVNFPRQGKDTTEV
jgi:hypothetical protein